MRLHGPASAVKSIGSCQCAAYMLSWEMLTCDLLFLMDESELCCSWAPCVAAVLGSVASPACLCWPEVLVLSVQVSELIYGCLQQLLAGAEDTWGIDMPWLHQRVQEVPGGV